ncbi:MAG: hypothetical protein ABIC40_06660 [bacterium]
MTRQKSPPEKNYHPLLPWFLRALAIILFFYWGLTHLIRPEWYLVKVMGITQYDPSNGYDVFSANLMGVLNAAFAITIWRAASNPLRFRIIIDMIILVSIGTVIVFVISILGRGLSPREWPNVALIGASIIVLLSLYPKYRKGEASGQ